MEITLFQDITTEDKLQALEADGLKYQGLFVDMDNKEERKYVKDNALLINNLLKDLDRARIAKTRDYKGMVEKEAGDIRERLQEANKPFTLLIDEHKAKRAKILAAEKAIEEAKQAAIQIEYDHGIALMENKLWEVERKEREQARIDNEKRIADGALELAKQKEEREKQNRLANEKHVSNTRKAAKESLMALGLDEAMAKRVVMAINNGSIQSVTINY